MSTTVSRRTFLQQTTIGGAGLFLGQVGARAQGSPNEKLNIAVVGVAHQGNYNLSNVSSQNIVALCDVDDQYLAAAKGKHPRATTYKDFRRLLDREQLDAVVVATPDHTHAVIAVAALKSGRHVYCEKPLTRTLSECRAVMEAARKQKLVTQIGTQIHAGSNYRRVVELVQAGAVGDITEVHVWVDASYGRKERPSERPPVPPHLNYDLWLGPVPERPYSAQYLPGAWRHWWAFGGGALADFGCHYMDLPHWALGLGVPLTAEVLDGPEPHPESVPPWLIVKYEYPFRGRTLKLTWYHGGKQPPAPVLASELAPKWRSGVLFVGARGQLLADYGRHQLLPESAFSGFSPPAPSIPESIGHHAEWIQACKTGGTTTCNFGYSGALTEAVLLGNVAFRAGCKLDWNSKDLAARNCPEAQQYVQHQYREGWKL